MEPGNVVHATNSSDNQVNKPSNKTIVMKLNVLTILRGMLLVCLVSPLCSCSNDEPSEDITSGGENNDEYLVEGSVDGHEYVDLGLSVKWAKCNVGAYTQEDFGNYYAWAETSTKTYYWAQTYKFYNEKTGTYNAPKTSICGTKYDVATSLWGSKWRLPSQKEAQELVDRCTWKAVSSRGVKGYEVTGPNGAKIFLPRAGSFTGGDKGAKAGIFTQLWTGSFYEETDFYFFAAQLKASDYKIYVDGASVDDGVSVRPVTTASGSSSSGGSSDNSGSTGSSEELYQTNFTFTATTSKITVNFYFSDRLSSATIKYGTTSSCSSSKSASVSAKCASATISGLKAGTKYYFKCTAKSSAGKSCTTDVYPAITNYN
ncbi:MAG: hypothetical protein HDS37_04745 [Bacteroides sp.]|nr:hypothetical protein [Bacteroides sp.]